jgi:pyruvate-formate lyase-activating enzyme
MATNNLSLKEEIKTLLSENLFVSQETKDYLFQRLDDLHLIQLNAVKDMLKSAQKKQKNIFKKILEKNPNFLIDLKHFTQNQIKELNKKSEENNQIVEFDILDDLETELNKI